tara:strand:- start:14761 stop:14970 length:210 start_codon:yes stop_codon:yes gene_type:complete
MTLQQWISKEGKKKIDVAGELDITPGHLSAICLRKTPPSFQLALKIKHYTKGEVSFEELAPASKAKEAA